MNVLALDASSDLLSVAVRAGGEVAEAALDRGRSQAERLMDLIEFCVSRAGLAPKDLDLIVCTQGPGSFTGLRIGMATAKGMALGLGRPWVAIPTLDCLAWGREAFRGAVAPVIDAKRGRVYSAVYLRGTRASAWLDVSLARLASLLDNHTEVLITGPDCELLEELAADRPGFAIDPLARTGAARAAAALGPEAFRARGAAAQDAGPLYLRRSEAEETADAAAGRPRPE